MTIESLHSELIGERVVLTGKIVGFLSPQPGEAGFNEPGQKTFKFKARGRQPDIVRGYNFPAARVGDQFTLSGRYSSLDDGIILEVTKVQKEEPEAKPSYGDAQFLSEKIAGIGKKASIAIVAALGDDAVEQLFKDPQLIYGVPGLTEAMKKSTLNFFGKTTREFIETFKFLQGFCGFSNRMAWKIWRKYREPAEKIIRNDPYLLLKDFERLHFDAADEIALKLGVKMDDPNRIRAAIMYTLVQAIFNPEEGHSYLAFSVVKPRVIDKLGATFVSGRKVNEEFEKLCKEELLYRCPIPGSKEEAIYTAREYLAEKTIASRLSLLALEEAKETVDYEKALKQIPSYLDESQRAAVLTALRSKASIICGSAGTGKTTILRTILKCLKSMGYDLNTDVLLCAFTGKAAKRMEEATGRNAKTIHRALVWSKVSGGFVHNASLPLQEKAIIVDEGSMLTNVLFADLLSAIPEEGKVVLIGDAHQLPPIGGGNVLRELRRSRKIPCSVLKYIHRQDGAEGSEIIEAAHDILSGRMPKSGKNFKIHLVPDDRAGRKLFIKMIVEADQAETIGLSPLRNYEMGVNNFNAEIQKKVNPQETAKSELKIGEKTRFREGDPVIHTRNNYPMGVMNGAIGRVISCNQEEGTILVAYDDAVSGKREVIYDKETAKFELDLCYCTTAYKIQGAEKNSVIIFVPQSAFSLNNRNSLYTMVTRGKKSVTLIGMETTIAECLKNDCPTIRNTMLAHRLNEEVLPGNIRDPEADND